MNNICKNLLLLVVCGWAMVAHSGVKVTALDWQAKGDRGLFTVKTDGAASAPEWKVKGNRVFMTIPDAQLGHNIEKYINGVRIAASNTSAGVLTTLTFLQGGAIPRNGISLNLLEGQIEVVAEFPTGATVVESVPAKAAIIPVIKKPILDESFLAKLEADEKSANTIVPKPVHKMVDEARKPIGKTDVVATKHAAPARDKSNFSIATYAGKFFAFLGVILLFFWGLVQMMKKGVLGKGKLGFLNGSSLVSVLSTTYVAPKRALLLVKAHNQVFLVASSEAGFEFLSEVQDVPGLVKEGERHIAGNNFDDEAREAEDRPVALSEKVDIYQSIRTEEKPVTKVSKDIARFSDELKKKVKNLKSLQ